MKERYLLRLDDACPTMHRANWSRMEALMDAYGIRPMVGIVPDNRNPELMFDPENKDFPATARRWQDKGWAIALHGLTHLHRKCRGGLNPLWEDTEFVGLPYTEQYAMLEKGLELLRAQGLHPEYFFAPSHTFDEVTLRALDAVGLNRISDTVALQPYACGPHVIIPQIGGKCRRMHMPGLFTFCLHPNTMTEAGFTELEEFLRLYSDRFMSFDQIDYDSARPLDMGSRILRKLYFLWRRLRAPEKGEVDAGKSRYF